MVWLHLVVIIFSALTLYFTYGDYKQNKLPNKTFILICIMEVVVIIVTAFALIISI